MLAAIEGPSRLPMLRTAGGRLAAGASALEVTKHLALTKPAWQELLDQAWPPRCFLTMDAARP
jgi:hypothetical protein